MDTDRRDRAGAGYADEQAAILSGIAARANDLNVKKNAKIAAITALTDIDDVIDYDVTAGW